MNIGNFIKSNKLNILIVIFLGLIMCITGWRQDILQVWRMPIFYITLIVCLIFIGIIFTVNLYLIDLLDSRLHWSEGKTKRFVAQMTMTIFFSFIALLMMGLIVEFLPDFNRDSYRFEINLTTLLLIGVVVNIFDFLKYEKIIVINPEPNIIKEPPAEITISSGAKRINFPISDIDLILLENGIVYLHTKNGENKIVNENMKYFENLILPSINFYRLNRQVIIARSNIAEEEKLYTGNLKIVPKNMLDVAIEVNKNKIKEYKDWLHNRS